MMFPPRECRRSLTIAILLLSLSTLRCATTTVQRMATVCTPDLSNYAPVVCVDQAGVPDRKEVHALNHDESGRPTTIVWIGPPSHELRVQTLTPGCLTQLFLDCQGSVCAGLTLIATPGGQKCPYATFIDGVAGTDPDVVIDPCC